MLNSNRANPSESDENQSCCGPIARKSAGFWRQFSETRAAKRQQRTALKNCGHARRPSRAAAASNLCFITSTRLGHTAA